jgi:Flp pilus assembly protein TadG
MLNSRRNHTSLRRESGQSAVEFALVAPVLIAVLLGIVQAGIAFHDYITVTDAARAAARKAVTARVSGLSITDVQQAAKDAAGDLDPTKLNVTVDDPTDPTFANGGSTLSVTVTYPYSINVLGWVVASGDLTSRMTERLE